MFTLHGFNVYHNSRGFISLHHVEVTLNMPLLKILNIKQWSECLIKSAVTYSSGIILSVAVMYDLFEIVIVQFYLQH